MKSTLLYTLLLSLGYVFADNADDIAKLENIYTCPDFSQPNENLWCLNCTFVDERSCLKSDEHTSTLYTYKTYECKNSGKQDCILPVAWSVFHRSFLASSVYPFGNLPHYDYKLKYCDQYGNDKLNPTCKKCTTVKDDYCLLNIFGVVCHAREYKCPEYDRGCHIFYNCTAPVNNHLPDFIPKLGLDGKAMAQKNTCNAEDIQPLEENPGCINCLYKDSLVCTVNTKYTETTTYYSVFECPLNDGKKCTLPQERNTYYAKRLKGVTVCPEMSENAICKNCTRSNQKSFVCSYFDFIGDLKTSSKYKLFTYTCPDNTKCFSDNGEEPVIPLGENVDFGSPPEDLRQFEKPQILASLSN